MTILGNCLRRLRDRVRPADERGVSIPIVLATVAITVGLTVVAADAAVRTEHQSQRSRGSEAALQAADAGINVALYRLNQLQPAVGKCPVRNGAYYEANGNSNEVANGLDWCPVDSQDTGGESGAFARIRVSAGARSVTDGLSEGCQRLQTRKIVSTGVARGATGKQVSRTVQATVSTVGEHSTFPLCGVLANEIRMQDRTRVDGSVGVNTRIHLSQRAKVWGDLYYNNQTKTWLPSELPTLTNLYSLDPAAVDGLRFPSRALNLAAAAEPIPTLDKTVNGAFINNNTALNDDAGVDQFGNKLGSGLLAGSCALNQDNYDYDKDTRVLMLKGRDGNGGLGSKCAAQLELKIGTTAESRTFRFCRLEVQDGAKLIIPQMDPNDQGPPVRIWIEDTEGVGKEDCPNSSTLDRVRIINEGMIVNPNGPSKLILQGEGMKLRTNGTQDPDLWRMCICGVWKPGGVGPRVANRKQDFQIVAPYWRAQFERYGTVFGGLLVSELFMLHRSQFEYDESLAEVINARANYAFRANSWNECRPVGVSSTSFSDSTC